MPLPEQKLATIALEAFSKIGDPMIFETRKALHFMQAQVKKLNRLAYPFRLVDSEGKELAPDSPETITTGLNIRTEGCADGRSKKIEYPFQMLGFEADVPVAVFKLTTLVNPKTRPYPVVALEIADEAGNKTTIEGFNSFAGRVAFREKLVEIATDYRPRIPGESGPPDLFAPGAIARSAAKVITRIAS